jgi:hypothetical protein
MILRLSAMLLPTIAGLQIATQQVAASYHYHAALGQPLLAHWYAPWKLPLWVWHWGAAHPDLYRGPLYMVLGAAVVGMVCSFAVRLLWRGDKTQPATFGSAAWTEKKAVERSGLL